MTSSIAADVECAPPAPCVTKKQFSNPLYAAEDDLDDYARIVLSDTDQSQRESRPASLEVSNPTAPKPPPDPLSPTGYKQPPTPDFPPPSPATAQDGIEKKIAPILEFVSV